MRGQNSLLNYQFVQINKMLKLFFAIAFFLIFSEKQIHAQDRRFTQVLKNLTGQINGMAQDKQGFLWLASFEHGLKRYDGINLRNYPIVTGYLIDMIIDKKNILWAGTLGTGLHRYDLNSNTITHFRHDPKDPSSLSGDTVGSILEDHLGNLWVGTSGGLDLFNPGTGKFTHYKHDINDPESLSNPMIFRVYEDRSGVIWVGCYPVNRDPSPGLGGLNRFDRKTGKFKRYLNDKNDPKSIYDNRIAWIYEDSKGGFWICGPHSAIQSMDRNTGEFTSYFFDPGKQNKLSQTSLSGNFVITPNIVSEDITGALWVSSVNAGIIRFDPITKLSEHFGYAYTRDGQIAAQDTAAGFVGKNASVLYNTKDGLFWVSTFDGELFKLDNRRTTIPFYPMSLPQANSFYCEENNNILWIGTARGLLRIDQATKKETSWKHDPKDKNSLCFNGVSGLRHDGNGNLWLATRNGLDKFDPVANKFFHYRVDPANPANIADNNFNYLIIDHNKNVWVAADSGISRLDIKTGLFTNFKKTNTNNNSLRGNYFLCIAEDNDNYIWAGSDSGAFRLDTKTAQFRQYASPGFVKSICVDSKGIVWLGGEQGLYYFDKAKDEFVLLADYNSSVSINNVINVLEDNQKNLWVSASSYLVRVSEDRKKLKKYTDANGIRYSNFFFNDNFTGKDGRIFLGEGSGYYAFYPDKLNDSTIVPQLEFSSFKLGDKEVIAGPDGILKSPVWDTEEIRLNHNQNVFSFDFFALDLVSPGDERYMFMLENYDDSWNDIGSDHRAFFFNIPPGKYIFRIKVISGDGNSSEKSIRIIISPPWWKKWWAYLIYGVLALLGIYFIYRYQKHYIVQKERERTQQKELAQAREIEKAYTDLKKTQAQLVQSEKMASLGELTAGIAHEIQNPLNFVNNFSEVNNELIEEMKDELNKGNIESAKMIAENISENEHKIIFHGKRADAIVKGMLQHSRSSSGAKEPTDINALADEYLRLAYHGLRAKDKSFNATMKTDFDNSIGKINIVPQDIGRVILNLITNAFYVVAEKRKQSGGNYEPVVTVSTKKVDRRIEIKVEDNGNGIPPKVLDKIFQPFFTTKPTGQGTGLGLSLSYDIVKAHGGELKVTTKEQEGSEFTIVLPV